MHPEEEGNRPVATTQRLTLRSDHQARDIGAESNVFGDGLKALGEGGGEIGHSQDRP
jgi:hypothetical protein